MNREYVTKNCTLGAFATAEAGARLSRNHRKVAQDVSFSAPDPASLAGEKSGREAGRMEN